MAKTPVAFLLAAVLALSIVSVLLYAQTMDLRTTNRDDVFAKFREFEIYKEFKEKYPDSVDDEWAGNGLYTLDSSYAEGGDKISLHILFDEESYFSEFHVVCDIDRRALQMGGAYFDAFEALHDNDCVIGDESSGPGPRIGHEFTVRIYEPDANTDSDDEDEIPLSDFVYRGEGGIRATLADPRFDADSDSAIETGPNTDTFEVKIKIPRELDGKTVHIGDRYEIRYTDKNTHGTDLKLIFKGRMG